MLLGWIAIGLIPSLWPHDRNRLDCTFLSMGHGCAVLLELPSGRTLLYDAGELGAPSRAVRTVAECLWERGFRHIDAVVLSHPDIDHYNALPGLLEKFSVGEVCVSPMMFEKNTRTVGVLRDAIEAHGVPLRKICGGDRISAVGGCTIDVLHPLRHGVLGPENANSIVLAVNYLGHRILLPGDVESPGLDDLLAEEPQRCEVLLAPHHGSRASNSPALAQWCRPAFVVFSGNGRWSNSEAEVPYQAVGGQVLHTHTSGAIHLRVDPQGLEVSTFCETANATEDKRRQPLGASQRIETVPSALAAVVGPDH
jgi:competence protein ComEC